MGISQFFKKDYILGLDIGSAAIKMVLFSSGDAGLTLMRVDVKELGSGEYTEEAARAIKSLASGIDLKNAKTIVNINCPQTSIKKITAPYMPQNELRDGILLEAKSYFPFSIEGAIVDFEITGDLIEKGVRKYDVAVAVCPTETSDKYVKIMEKAGVKPNSFVTTPYALEKIARISPKEKDETTAHLDIGAKYTELVIIKNGNMVFSRKIPVSGDGFTKSLTGALVSDKGKMQLSTAEAETVKQEIGIPKDSDTSILIGKISAQQVLSMIRSPLEQLVSEIERCFDYYREESGHGRVDSIILSGGGASLSGLTGYLSENLGLVVRLSDPISLVKSEKSVTAKSSGFSHRMAPAIGAILSADNSINLLPVAIKDEKVRIVKRGVVEVIVTAVVILSILLYTGIRISITNFDKRISVAKLELSSMATHLAKAEAQALANSVLMDEPQWEDIFKELSNLIPDSVHITNFSMNDNIMTLKGVVAAQDGEEILSNFVLTLENGIFSSVKLVESKDLGDKAGIEFELKCWVDYQ